MDGAEFGILRLNGSAAEIDEDSDCSGVMLLGVIEKRLFATVEGTRWIELKSAACGSIRGRSSAGSVVVGGGAG